jgi:hypothetical protein
VFSFLKWDDVQVVIMHKMTFVKNIIATGK